MLKKDKRAPEIVPARMIAAQSPQSTKAMSTNYEKEKRERNSKQARVIAILRSPAGATIAAVMKATGWQHHSVRGFLAGVVRKKLRFKLSSKKVDGNRIYQIMRGGGTKSGPRQSKRRSS